jgi:alkylated DNA nucleotide flippase Atl1
MNTSTGVVTVTGASIVDYARSVNYTVTKTNDAGSVEATLALEIVYKITVRVTNADGNDDQVVTIREGAPVDEPPDISYATPEVYVKGTDPGTVTPTNTGGEADLGSWEVVAGSLPAGRVLNTDGTITGTPTTVSNGTFQISCFNSEGSSTSNVVVWSVAINLPVIVYAGSPYTKNIGDTVNAPCTNTGGDGVFTEFSGTSLASYGLSLNPTTGAITGTLAAFGSISTVIRCTNATGTDDATFAATVSNIAPIPTYGDRVLLIGRPVTIIPGNSGGAITSTSGGATLPSWATLNADGTITGTPDAVAVTTVTDVTATNAIGSALAPSFRLIVVAALSGPPQTPGEPGGDDSSSPGHRRPPWSRGRATGSLAPGWSG